MELPYGIPLRTLRDFCDLVLSGILIDTLAAFGNQRGLTPARVALAWLLAQKPFIVPIPGTTKLAHLQENLWSADFQFTPGELSKLTKEVSKIKIVGDRYTGTQAEQAK